MDISFNKKQQDYILKQINSGEFQNASEVVCDALRIHEEYHIQTIKQLRTEIEEGWSGDFSNRTVLDIIRAKKEANHKNV